MKVKFEDLKGKTLIECYRGNSNDEDYIIFKVSENEIYKMFHEQDCCESVTIEDICGELEWLVGSPIILAEERSNPKAKQDEDDYCDSETWTFYEISTFKGAVTIRWYGVSNGYYSERVDFELMEMKKDVLD